MHIQIKILNKEFYAQDKELTPTSGPHYTYPEECAYRLPSYATPGSAAMDLVCTTDVVIYPGEVKAIPTGLAIWIGSGISKYPGSYGYVNTCDVAALILPRSGLGTRGLVLANTIGLIDEDYQGELIVQAWNRNNTVGWEDFYLDNDDKNTWLGREPYRISDSKDAAIKLKAGDRFAQLLFIPAIKAQFEVVEEFSISTERGAGGFGSTDK